MLLGFKKQFAPKILNGSKIFTIRDERKVTPKIGEQLHMYTGLRTKHTELITREFTLKGIYELQMRIEDNKSVILINSKQLSYAEKEEFVTCDGFECVSDFIEYWDEGWHYKKIYLWGTSDLFKI